MSHASAFSPDYTAARARFRSSSIALGCSLEEHPIGQVGPDDEALTIDVARLGAKSAKRLVVISSGLHGVEGHFGSAVQAAMLEEQLGGYSPPKDAALLLIHALNPYGFAWTRRVNEDNVDLNRNFLGAGEAYEGSPQHYPTLDPLFNPQRAPSVISAFKPQAALTILKYGMTALKNTLPVGQYDFPKGLFYGGSGPSRSMQILDAELPRWVGSAERVIHVDLHTGLGAWGEYKLFTNCDAHDPRAVAMSDAFDEDYIEAWDPATTSYEIQGGLGTWCRQRLPKTIYDQVTAEFGTFNIIRIVQALRAENMAHHWGDPEAATTKRAKKELLEAFAPRHTEWRHGCVEKGLQIAEQAIEAAFS